MVTGVARVFAAMFSLENLRICMHDYFLVAAKYFSNYQKHEDVEAPGRPGTPGRGNPEESSSPHPSLTLIIILACPSIFVSGVCVGVGDRERDELSFLTKLSKRAMTSYRKVYFRSRRAQKILEWRNL